jgi:hypothetical protein
MLSVSQGRLIMLSTPWAMRGTFYTTFNEENNWQKFKVTADQVSRISPEFLDEERAAMGPFFRTEYLCEWIEDENSFFTHDEIEAAISDEVKPLFETLSETSALSGAEMAATPPATPSGGRAIYPKF